MRGVWWGCKLSRWVIFTAGMDSFSPRFISDKEFDDNFPKEIERLSGKHWAPATIAKRAAKFLVNRPGVRVLDIGSGAGKFCVIGAACNDALFYGVEQRENLCRLADKIAQHYQLSNVKFIHANVIDIDFSQYNAFFFYNAFYENIEDNNAIDSSVELDPALYQSYTLALTEKLLKMPAGTRLVTYWGEWVPEGYELVYTNGNDSLRFWEKG
jgi:SAM-dependent methyltransferase